VTIDVVGLGKRRVLRQVHQRRRIGEAIGRDRDLDDFGPRRSHGPCTLGKVRRHTVEGVHREDNPASPPAADHRGDELGTRFNVDVFRPGGLGLGQQTLALLLRSGKAASLPRGPARHNDRATSSFHCAEGIRLIDRVEAHFDHVGVRRRIARAPELIHRSSGHGDAHQGVAHEHQKEKASSAVAEEALWNL
jgi:hypothetical protein